jgi:hypothetical protein
MSRILEIVFEQSMVWCVWRFNHLKRQPAPSDEAKHSTPPPVAEAMLARVNSIYIWLGATKCILLRPVQLHSLVLRQHMDVFILLPTAALLCVDKVQRVDNALV